MTQERSRIPARHGRARNGDVARRRIPRRALLRGVGASALVLAGAGAWLVWDNRRIVTTRYEVVSRRLPEAFDGFRIVQVSDLHSASFGRGNERLLEAVSAEHPELIALTGDLVDRRTTDLSIALDAAGALRGIAPTAFVTGNHEADSALLVPLLAGLEERRVELLRTSSRALARGEGEGDGGDSGMDQSKGTSTIRLAGIDDPWLPLAGEDPAVPYFPEERTAQRLAQALEGSAIGTGADESDASSDGSDPSDPFTLLLTHRPEQIDAYADARVDVALAGHAHGGQVRIPGIGGLFAPNQGFLPSLTAGIAERDRTRLVISRGLGNSLDPVRVNDPPEIVAITLRRG